MGKKATKTMLQRPAVFRDCRTTNKLANGCGQIGAGGGGVRRKGSMWFPEFHLWDWGPLFPFDQIATVLLCSSCSVAPNLSTKPTISVWVVMVCRRAVSTEDAL